MPIEKGKWENWIWGLILVGLIIGLIGFVIDLTKQPNSPVTAAPQKAYTICGQGQCFQADVAENQGNCEIGYNVIEATSSYGNRQQVGEACGSWTEIKN